MSSAAVHVVVWSELRRASPVTFDASQLFQGPPDETAHLKAGRLCGARICLTQRRRWCGRSSATSRSSWTALHATSAASGASCRRGRVMAATAHVNADTGARHRTEAALCGRRRAHRLQLVYSAPQRDCRPLQRICTVPQACHPPLLTRTGFPTRSPTLASSAPCCTTRLALQ